MKTSPAVATKGDIRPSQVSDDCMRPRWVANRTSPIPGVFAAFLSTATSIPTPVEGHEGSGGRKGGGRRVQRG